MNETQTKLTWEQVITCVFCKSTDVLQARYRGKLINKYYCNTCNKCMRLAE